MGTRFLFAFRNIVIHALYRKILRASCSSAILRKNELLTHYLRFSHFTCPPAYTPLLKYDERRVERIEEEKAKIVFALWGTTDLAPGWFEEMDDKKNGHLEEWMLWKKFTPHRTMHHPPITDVSPKNVLQIILAAKWLVQHSSTSPKQQRRPLYSLLFDSSSMVEWQVMQLAGHLLPIVMLHSYQRIREYLNRVFRFGLEMSYYFLTF